jgi:hypothetical protein
VERADALELVPPRQGLQRVALLLAPQSSNKQQRVRTGASTWSSVERNDPDLHGIGAQPHAHFNAHDAAGG